MRRELSIFFSQISRFSDDNVLVNVNDVLLYEMFDSLVDVLGRKVDRGVQLRSRDRSVEGL